MWNPKAHNRGLISFSKAIILSILVEGHYMMLHAKYESSSLYGLGQGDF